MEDKIIIKAFHRFKAEGERFRGPPRRQWKNGVTEVLSNRDLTSKSMKDMYGIQ